MRKFKVALYIQINLNIMSVLGYLEPRGMKEDEKIIYKFYSIFLTFALCLLDIMAGFEQMFVETDIEKATSILFILLAKVTLLVKLFSVKKNQNKLLEIIHKNRPEFFPDDGEQCRMFEKASAFQKRVTIIFHLMGILASLTMCFFPFIDPGMSGQLPFAAWYPFEVSVTPMYQIIITYQTVCLLFMSLLHVGTDMLITGFLMVASNQLDILSYQILSIKRMAVESFEAGDTKLIHSDMLKRLVECIKHYNGIVEFADEVTAIFSMPIFFLFLLGVGAIGLTLFQFILTPILTMEFFSIAVYQSCILLEIFLYCFYGNSITVKSDALTTALYQCGWEDGSLQFKRDLNRFMTRIQKPFRLYAGNCFLMSLPSFILILKWSWSYFTLLHRIHEKNQ